MPHGPYRARIRLLGLAVLLAPASAAADVASSGVAIQAVSTEVSSLSTQVRTQIGEPPGRYIENRLADADLFFRLGFYEEASLLYLDIVDNYASHVAFSDALFRLAESLYQGDDPYGAREYFEQVLNRASDPRFRPYIQDALGRLIELAIHLEDFAGIERYFAEMHRLPTADAAAVTPYFRGKYHYFQGNLTEAERSFLLVPDGTRYSLEGRYFLGVVHTRRGNYPQAMTAFREVLAMPVVDDEDAEVIDLAHLAIGRLGHEIQDGQAAIEAYQRVSTDSRYFDQALYEVSWVHIGRGDSTRARRALELLVIYDPNSRFAPEARLLLGNILLRDGRVVASEQCFLLNAERLAAADAHESFTGGAVTAPALPPLPAECLNRPGTASSDYAVEAFESVKRAYGSVYEGLAHAMSSREGLRAYFRDMIRSDVAAVTAPTMLPAEARAWFESDPGVSRVQTVLESLANVRRYVAETERLVNQLDTILSGRSMVGAFAELRGMRDRSVELGNRCARIRSDLAAERDRIVSAPAGEAAQVRQERRAVEEEIRRLPVDSESLAGTYEVQRTGIDALSQQLTEVAHLVELVYSIANSLDQYLVLPENWGRLTEAEIDAVRSEVQLVRGAVGHYRGRADDLRRQVEVVRAQVQVGEVSTESARELRDRHRRLVEREGALLGAGAAPTVASALAALAAVEAELRSVEEVLEGQAGDRSRTLLVRVREERGRLEGYRSRLAGIETAAEQVVGEYAFHNFEVIAARFAELMLRSDVGVADAAWMLVEEHDQRQTQMAEQLSREREAIRMEYDDLPSN